MILVTLCTKYNQRLKPLNFKSASWHHNSIACLSKALFYSLKNWTVLSRDSLQTTLDFSASSCSWALGHNAELSNACGMLRLDIVSEHFTWTENALNDQQGQCIIATFVTHLKAIWALAHCFSQYISPNPRKNDLQSEQLQTRQSFHMHSSLHPSDSNTSPTCTGKSSLAPTDYTWKSHAHCIPLRNVHCVQLF